MTNARSLRTLPFFLLACFIALSFGALFGPGEWYTSLAKAPWTPPNIAFPIVWTILYVLIAIAGWHIFSSRQTKLKWLWSIQLILNALWSWIFFGQHWVGIALIDIFILDCLVASMLLLCWQHELTMAAYLMTPYLVWLLIATSLNTYVVVMN